MKIDIALVLRFVVLLTVATWSSASAAGQETLIGVRGSDFIILGADSSISQSIALLTPSHIDKITVLVDPFPFSSGRESERQQDHLYLSQREHGQQTIVAAAAGDFADVDRLVQLLAAQIAISEYEASVGCDVHFVPCGGGDVDTNMDVDVDVDGADRSTDRTTNTIIPPATPPGMSVDAVARLARHHIATRLRSATPLQVCMLIAGMVPERRSASISATADAASALATHDDAPNLHSSLHFTAKQVQLQLDNSKQQRQNRDLLAVQPDTDTHSQQQQPTPEPEQQASSPLSSLQRQSLSRGWSLQPRLYWLDQYGSLQTLHYGAHGFGSNFCWSILDQRYRPNLTKTQAIELVQECFAQLRQRYVINSPQPPCIKCIDAQGCTVIHIK